MRIRRRSLRKLLIAVGCFVATVEFPSAATGSLLMLVGSGLHFWSKGILEQNRRLTTAGPYRWSRNPFYLGVLLIDLGICLVIGQVWLSVAFMALWVYVYRKTILREEARLLELFPDEFPRYCDAVPRLIPTGRRLDPSEVQGFFSLANPALARGSEYARLLGIALAPGVILAAEIVRRERLRIFESENEIELALIVLLFVLWIVKLALAERFRRPETILLPFPTRPTLRQGVTVGLVVVAWLIGDPWALNIPLVWVLVLFLDVPAQRQSDVETDHGRVLWRRFPMIAAAAVALALCIGVLVARAAPVG